MVDTSQSMVYPLLPSYLTMAQPGEQIGLRFAHNILADITQDSLSSFHNAGLANDMGPEQALQDIIDGIHGGGMNISLVNPTKTQRTVRDITYRQLKYYIKRITNSILEQPEDGNFWYTIGRELGILDGPADIPMEDLIIIRFELDYHKLSQDHRTLKFIVDTVFSDQDHVYFSPDFMGIIDVHISNVVEISDTIQLVDKFIGICGVDKCSIIENKIICTGSNLQEISMIRSVDMVHTTSNDVYDVEANFGIEAARNVIMTEMSLGSNNKESASFIADYMTCKGKVSAFKKDNPMLVDKDLLASIAFERPKGDLKNMVANKKQVDISLSVYSQIICGKKPDMGSGSRLFEIIP